MALLGIAIQTISPLFAEKVKKNWNGKKVAKIYQKLNKKENVNLIHSSAFYLLTKDMKWLIFKSFGEFIPGFLSWGH